MACAKGQKFVEKVDFKEKTTAARDFGHLYNELFIYEKRSGCGKGRVRMGRGGGGIEEDVRMWKGEGQD